ncbi:hypothetical protein H0H92_001885, partial [Tricholoma furcatifolium]
AELQIGEDLEDNFSDLIVMDELPETSKDVDDLSATRAQTKKRRRRWKGGYLSGSSKGSYLLQAEKASYYQANYYNGIEGINLLHSNCHDADANMDEKTKEKYR